MTAFEADARHGETPSSDERRAPRIAVVGAGGQLGAAIAREFGTAGWDVRRFSRRELDVTDYRRVASLAETGAAVVVNCTAFNDVDEAEDRPEAAMAINAAAVRSLAVVAEAAGAAFVHFSTDFVFDGAAEDPYAEEDDVRPLNWYGRSKAIGEWWATRVPRHYVLRLSSVFGGRRGEGLGGRGSIDRMIDQTLSGGEVRAFVDRTVTPSYAPDVARATRRLIEIAPPGIYHCVNSGATTWTDLAVAIAELTGVRPQVAAVPMRSVSMHAPRPLRCALSNARLAASGVPMPEWRHALARHVAHRLAGDTHAETATC